MVKFYSNAAARELDYNKIIIGIGKTTKHIYTLLPQSDGDGGVYYMWFDTHDGSFVMTRYTSLVSAVVGAADAYDIMNADLKYRGRVTHGNRTNSNKHQ